MALERYRQKRNFSITPEPEGKLAKSKSQGLSFVIQKHAATRLHYDFRLELDGVLLSWAVPKGPSLDPNDKRLAMHVEDHPIEYGDFEGVIPPKQYGAGTVMLWDRGIWVPKTDPREGYAKGRLKFHLEGEKLHGGWNLVRGSGSQYGGKGWLLIKESDEYARLGPDASIVDEKPRSVVTDRTLDEIKADADRVWHSNRSVAANVKEDQQRKTARLGGIDKIAGAKKGAMPAMIEPQLATSTKTPPDGENWVHEIKFDGYRMLCRIENGKASMISRSGKDWTGDFPAIVRAAGRLPVDTAWLDGEVVAMDGQGQISFQALQNALSAQDPDLQYFAFDLIYIDGFDLCGAALTERKKLLQRLLEHAPNRFRYSEHFAVPGSAFLQNVGGMGLEGMVSKRADQPYRSGRGTSWLKIKCKRTKDMVIGGFTDEKGSKGGLGALLLGHYEPDGTLTYCGKVGSGFDAQMLVTLRHRLDELVQQETPFRNPPTGVEGRRAHWVKPVLVASISFTEWTDDGTLRHAIFHGLREDLEAREVKAETEASDERVEPLASSTAKSATKIQAKSAAAVPSSKAGPQAGRDTIAGITLSNANKILYTEAGFTKRDLALYYAAIGDWILPHLRDRPLTLVRCPDGWDKECFYQKKAEHHVSETLDRVKIRTEEGVSLYMMANSLSAVIALVQLGALELHPWGSCQPKLGFPDRIVLDLDPDEEVPWENVTQAAQVVRTLLDAIGLHGFLKTTGGKGLHVVVPIEPTVAWEHIKGFTKSVAELLERTFPDRFTSKMLKVSRRGRIYVDYLRNAEGATAVCAYSTRAKANAPVSTPIAWDELEDDVRYAHFNIVTVPKRMARLKSDPWAGMTDAARPVTRNMMKQVGYI